MDLQQIGTIIWIVMLILMMVWLIWLLFDQYKSTKHSNAEHKQRLKLIDAQIKSTLKDNDNIEKLCAIKQQRLEQIKTATTHIKQHSHKSQTASDSLRVYDLATDDVKKIIKHNTTNKPLTKLKAVNKAQPQLVPNQQSNQQPSSVQQPMPTKPTMIILDDNDVTALEPTTQPNITSDPFITTASQITTN